MHNSDRYRKEDDRFCIDIRLKTSRQLFDGRDPAPFRERDLDDQAVEYLLGALAELPRGSEVKLVFWLSDEPSPPLPEGTIVEAVRAHFGYEEEQFNRRVREHLRRAQLSLLLGLAVLVAFLSLAELSGRLLTGPPHQIAREGLVITGWVAMWRPLEALLYDWWPLVTERNRRRKLRNAPIEVRASSDIAAAHLPNRP